MRFYKLIPASLCLSIALLSLSGCGLLPERDTTPINEYSIAPDVAVQSAATPCEQVLGLRNVDVSPPWETSDMLYSQTEHQISSFAYNRWTAAPSRLIGNALLDALQRSGLYRGVLAQTSPGSPDLILAVNLERGPIQIFPSQSSSTKGGATSSKEVIALSASLVDGNSGKLLANETFAESREARPNPYGGVVAANEITARLIAQMLDWLAHSNATIAACSAH